VMDGRIVDDADPATRRRGFAEVCR